MKIDGGNSYLFAGQQAQMKNAARTNDQASFKTVMAEESHRDVGKESAARAETGQTDFSHMTRQELRDWMNEQIRSGSMSLDQSSSLVAMTAAISVGPEGAAVDNARIQNERVNFFDIAQNGLDFYLSRGDLNAAEKVREAIDIMKRA
ncbi:hypothetical protein CAI21_04725 [Alkalilimnicola ehrlichii]|uniref:Uncharacterized protein n=1 Tax=Alkalilimnicola ehrlichii TaxID=351052 RepID=A0A3E0X1N4_9GAMM|nr:hypothetical protein [Alkalilimnicola ehrlichii]RFA30811.1 hypothetical protein CAI21_04725 [Alkalilimnicola ehrlichii]RFA38387.1 hypothetical protein CAL65_06090 [Alkalilimnicola ehrlichii]